MDNIRINFESETIGIDEARDRLEELKDTNGKLITLMEELQKAKNKVFQNKDNMSVEEYRKEVGLLNKDIRTVGGHVAQTSKSINTLHTALKNVQPTVAAGAATKKLSTQLREARNEMGQLEMAGKRGGEQWNELAEKSAKLQTQITHTGMQMKALSHDTLALAAVTGGAQGLTGAFNASQSAMALLGGESEELQQAFFKVQASLQVLNGVQMLWNATNRNSALAVALSNAASKVTTKLKRQEASATVAAAGATNVQTAAATKATVTTWLWNAALLANPLFWIVAAIMAAVAAIAVLVKIMGKQGDEQKKLNELEALRLERLQKTNDALKKAADLRVAQLNRELELLRSIGASEAELAKKQEEILQAQLDGAKELEKSSQQEIKNIEENKAKLEELERALHNINKAKADGKKKVTIEVDGEMKEVKVKKSDKMKEDIQGQIDNLNASISVGIDVSEGLYEAENKIDVFRNEQAQKERERNIRDAAIIAQIRLDAAKKGTAQELQLRINLIESERQVALSAANLTQAEMWKINSDANRKIAEARQGYAKQQLIDEKTGIEARLALAKEGSMEEFDLRKQLLFQQYQIEIENVHLTNNEREKLYNEYVKNLRKINDDFNKQASADALNTQVATLNAQLSGVEKGTAAELELRRQLAEKQAAIERLNIETSVMNEELRAARLLEVDAKLKADLEQNQRDYEQRLRDYEQKRIDNKLRVTHTEIEAERIKNEKILASTTDNFIKRNKARQNLRQLELEAVEAEMNAIAEMRELDIINEEEYLMRKAELRNEHDALEIEALQEKQEAINAIRQASFELGVSLITDMMNAQKEALQQQLADMKEYYTTSEDEAKENSDKQLITKEELARKELEIKRKIAEAEKRDAIFRATVDGIAGVIKALGAAPPPLNFVLAALTGAAVAAQIVKISSKELPKYAKGKKGKKVPGGEWSWVGEQGPEIQWIPNSASIIPAHKSKNLTPDILREFNIKVPDIPAMPRIKELPDIDGFRGYKDRGGFSIDYDRLGKAVAENVKIPEVKQLNVELNENGYTKYLTSNSGKTKIFNTRYSFN